MLIFSQIGPARPIGLKIFVDTHGWPGVALFLGKR